MDGDVIEFPLPDVWIRGQRGEGGGNNTACRFAVYRAPHGRGGGRRRRRVDSFMCEAGAAGRRSMRHLKH